MRFSLSIFFKIHLNNKNKLFLNYPLIDPNHNHRVNSMAIKTWILSKTYMLIYDAIEKKVYNLGLIINGKIKY